MCENQAFINNCAHKNSAGDFRVKLNKGISGECKFCSRDFEFVLCFIMELFSMSIHYSDWIFFGG